MTVETPLDLIREATGRDETIRAAVVTERLGDVVSVLVIREQPAQGGEGTVLHLRFAKVDLDRHSVSWAPSNGMFIGRTSNVPVGLVKAFAAVRDGAEEVVLNGLNGGNDEIASEILRDPLDQEPSEPVDHSRTAVEGNGPTVTCQDCGEEIPREEAVNFGGGTVDVWVHDGPCPSDVGEVEDR